MGGSLENNATEPVHLSAGAAARRRAYKESAERVGLLLDGEDDWVAALATVVCELHHSFAYFHWTGFYRARRGGKGALAVGPYQGGHGCLRIPKGKGVCGACAETRRTQLVPDVHAFPGHIACSGSTQSELVVPVVAPDGTLLAVLDIDSDHPAAFTEVDQEELEILCETLASGPWAARETLELSGAAEALPPAPGLDARDAEGEEEEEEDEDDGPVSLASRLDLGDYRGADAAKAAAAASRRRSTPAKARGASGGGVSLAGLQQSLASAPAPRQAPPAPRQPQSHSEGFAQFMSEREDMQGPQMVDVGGGKQIEIGGGTSSAMSLFGSLKALAFELPGDGSNAIPATLIWLHDNGETVQTYGESLPAALAGLPFPLRVIIPTGPMRYCANLGQELPAWCDSGYARLYSELATDPAGFDINDLTVLAEIDDSCNRARRVYDESGEKHRVVVAGAGVGGGIAVHSVLTSFRERKPPVVGAVSVCGGAPFTGHIAKTHGGSTAPQVPLLLVMGERDMTAGPEYVVCGCETLQKAGFQSGVAVVPGGEHKVGAAGLGALRTALEAWLCAGAPTDPSMMLEDAGSM